MPKRYIEDQRTYVIDQPSDMSDDELIEAYNFGDISGEEHDGRIILREFLETNEQ